MIRSLRGLRVQLLLWAIVPLIIAVVGVSVLGIVTHQTAMRDLIAERDAQLAGVAADLLDERLLLHIRLLETVAAEGGGLPELPEFDGGLLHSDNEGKVVATSPGEADWALRSERVAAAVEEVRQTRSPYISNPFIDPLTDRRSLLVAVPNPSGGVLAGLASFGHLGVPTMIDGLGTGRRGVTSLIDGQGIVIYHPDPGQEGLDISDREGIGGLQSGERGATLHLEPDGEEMVIGYSPVQLVDWGLVIHEPWADAIAPLMRASEMIPVILTLVVVAALLAVFFGVRYIIQPLQRLEREATRVALGQFDAVQEPVGGVEEIETLRQTLSRMTSRIQEYQTALRHYLAAITRAEEEERQRVARDLHDETVQNLIALGHRVEMCEKAAGDPEELARRLEEVRSLATATLNSTRRLIHNLRPEYLEDLGLVAAVEALEGDVRLTGDTLTVKVDVVGNPQRLDQDVELAAFRIVQEALNNVIRHAQAQRAEVRLKFEQEQLVLTVKDDGVGFAVPQAPQEMVREGHLGLMGIHERALRFGGHLSVDSEPGRGSELIVTLPYRYPSLAPIPS